MEILMDQPKMSRRQAKLFWDNLTPKQRMEFNKMYSKLTNKELHLTHINVTEDEKIVNIVLDDNNKPGKPDKPFYEHFKPIIDKE